MGLPGPVWTIHRDRAARSKERREVLVMSLIEMRRRRKRNWIDHQKGMGPVRLIVLLGFTIAIIWYLTRY